MNDVMESSSEHHPHVLGNSVAHQPQVERDIIVSSGEADKANKARILNTSALDGFRAFAVFHIVLGHHTIYTNWTGQEPGSKDDGFSDGFDLMGGVSMGAFYILSGFVLMLGYGNVDGEPKNCRSCLCCCGCCDSCCLCMCDTPQKDASAQPRTFDSYTFFWKRFARLGPLWYLGNLLSLPLFFTNHWWVGPPERFWPGLALMLPPLGLNSVFMLFPPAGHLWTISTMTFFYLMFPKLYYRVRRIQPHKLRAFAMMLYGIQCVQMILGAVGVGILDPEMGYWFARAWPPNRLPVFIMGLCGARQCLLEAEDHTLTQSCCSLDSLHLTKGTKVIVLCVIFGLVVLLGIVEQLLGELGLTRFFGEVFMPALFYELIIALAYASNSKEPPSRLHKFLGCRTLRFLADISLAVYVVHETFIRTLVLVIQGPVQLTSEGKQPENMERNMPAWGIAITFLLSVVVGWLLTVFFEKPMSKFILQRALGSSSSTA